MPRVYQLDRDYEDRKDRDAPNEFVRWLDIRNAGGIREMMTRARTKTLRDVAALILVSRHVEGSSYNPWEDVVDRINGRIWFWGDAKAHDEKRRDDFLGNRRLVSVSEAVNAGRWSEVPPILHFSKHNKGMVRFNGLCVLTKLEEAWFDDDGVRVRNYRAMLDILPVEDVAVDWLHARRVESVPATLLHDRGRRTHPTLVTGELRNSLHAGPPAWQRYALDGYYDRLTAYVSRVRSKPQQLPGPGTPLRQQLERLWRLNPQVFETRVVEMFQKMEVSHRITQTQYRKDGGFDFFGSFQLPPPLRYSIPLKGEVKRYDPSGSGVGPSDVARLVARLQRGEHGVFVTTSYFTQQCQEEVYADKYPAELISGGQLVGMMAQVGMAL